MKPDLDIFDRLQLFLFNHKDSNEFMELYNSDFKDVSKAVLRDKAYELQKKGRIEIKPLGTLAISFHSKGGPSVVNVNNVNSTLKARIKIDGVDYVKQNLIKNMGEHIGKKTEITNHGSIGNINTGDANRDVIQKVNNPSLGDGFI